MATITFHISGLLSFDMNPMTEIMAKANETKNFGTGRFHLCCLKTAQNFLCIWTQMHFSHLVVTFIVLCVTSSLPHVKR